MQRRWSNFFNFSLQRLASKSNTTSLKKRHSGQSLWSLQENQTPRENLILCPAPTHSPLDLQILLWPF